MPKRTGFSKSNAQLKKLPTKKQTAIDKKALLSYLSAEYGITYFHTKFIYKLNHIHEGTMQNLQASIPYGVLLDMFRFYKYELDEQRVYNKKIGKTFSDVQGALNYDLAIILSKHPDYLSALEEEKIWAADNTTAQSAVKLVKKAAPAQGGDDTVGNIVDIGKMLEEW